MIPRLKSSKKWTAFPQEYSDQIATVFKENFANYIEKGRLIVEGRIYPSEIVLRVGFLEEGRLAQANFEVSMDYSPSKKDAIKRIHNCVDAAAAMMLDYWESEEEQLDLPYTWKETEFQGKKLYLQFNTENSSLEAEANKLLGIDADTLLLDEEEDEDALSRAEVKAEVKTEAGTSESDDEDIGDAEDYEDEDLEKGPRMFGGLTKKKKEGLH